MYGMIKALVLLKIYISRSLICFPYYFPMIKQPGPSQKNSLKKIFIISGERGRERNGEFRIFLKI